MRNKTITDCEGSLVLPGDILMNINANDPFQYFVCFKYNENSDAEIRDLNTNNIGTDTRCNLINIGHFSNHLDKLCQDDLQYYFGIDLYKVRANRALVEIRKAK